MAAVLAYAVAVWRSGRGVLWDKLYAHALSTRSFVDKLDPKLARVPGTAVFMTGNLEVVPNALLHNIKHNKVLHERVLLMTVRMHDVPHVPEAERVEAGALGRGFFRAVVNYGFMDRPDVPAALRLCRAPGLAPDVMLTSFFMSRETLVRAQAAEANRLSRLDQRVYMLLAAGAVPATAYFCIPPDRVVELGMQVEI